MTSEIAMMASRRGLLRGTGIGVAALGAATLGLTTKATAEAAITDEDVLNFALNLEYLEAEFYRKAVYGVSLPESAITGTGTLGKVTGGSKVPFSTKAIFDYAREIANDEYNHVLFLRKALGNAAVARPAINLSTSFLTLGQAAGSTGKWGAFNPFASEEMFLLGAFVFEDVGVTAYAGAAAAISTPAYLTAAASILAVEAYHAAALRLLILQSGERLSKQADSISALRAQLSGAQDDQGPGLPKKPNLVPTDSNSLAFTRTPSQVLEVVYGGGAASDYLFFPNKTNGTIS
jgi:hypothetical protein